VSLQELGKVPHRPQSSTMCRLSLAKALCTSGLHTGPTNALMSHEASRVVIAGVIASPGASRTFTPMEYFLFLIQKRSNSGRRSALVFTVRMREKVNFGMICYTTGLTKFLLNSLLHKLQKCVIFTFFILRMNRAKRIVQSTTYFSFRKQRPKCSR